VRADLRDITIDEINIRTIDDADVVRLNTFDNLIKAETDPDDPPAPVDATRRYIRNIPGFRVVRTFWARDADRAIAASASTAYTDVPENRHLIGLQITVRGDRRRRGIARALLGHLVDAAEDTGRTLADFGTSERVPAGDAFAARLGARRGIATHTNRLLLSGVDVAMIRRWAAEGPDRARGYSLVGIDGRYPDELIEAIADVHEVMNTAPRDNLDVEDQRVTPQFLRTWEASMLAQGHERWSVFVRHDASGRLIGLSEVYYAPDEPQTVYQGDTGVHPDHRGHAIGKWMKAVMLERILRERTQAVDVRTGNADSNEAMLGINDELGFCPYRARTWWQVPVERVRAYVGSSV